MRTIVKIAAVQVAILFLGNGTSHAQSLMETLGRGLVAVRTTDTDVYIGWRLLGTDPADIAFNVYRAKGAKKPVKLNDLPITSTTNFVDNSANLKKLNTYFVQPIINGVEGQLSEPFALPRKSPVRQFLSIPLQIPPGGTAPDGVRYSYLANDCSVGDLDGDGEFEIILKWDPSNSKDNSQSGYTGNVYLDAYQMDGTRLWRIDLGRNIRAGAHYTQFLVYDFDGDRRAEVACRTADGTIDGTGRVLGDGNADWRNSAGYVLSGPEYLTIFDGLTGGSIATTDYVPARGNVSDWGDDYGNRVDRFLAGVAYLGGARPSLVMCRGYYTRTVLVAWDWRNGLLTERWRFDTRTDADPGLPAPGFERWEGMGNHQLSVGDVDGDGRDEIMYGSCCIDDDGTGLYTTGLGHGDALHMSDMDPDRPGLEVYQPHESPALYGPNGSEFRDARTGELIWGVSGQGADVGRGVAMDIDPRYRGYEAWSARGGLYSCKGQLITNSRPSSMNFGVWWDADLLREFLDSNHIDKWNIESSSLTRLITAGECSSNNGTKATPCLSADILGDWREEVIWRTSDDTELHIYTTTVLALNRFYTLMHDRQYRLAIAWQNTAYNQPPHPGFYLGEGMNAQPVPDIVTSVAGLRFERVHLSTRPGLPAGLAAGALSGSGRVLRRILDLIGVRRYERAQACRID
jgi:rhamnogalacturonan endolyase